MFSDEVDLSHRQEMELVEAVIVAVEFIWGIKLKCRAVTIHSLKFDLESD